MNLLSPLVQTREELDAVWHALGEFVENVETADELLSDEEVARGVAARRVLERIDAAYASLAGE